jgi:signal transduction histidine kinase
MRRALVASGEPAPRLHVQRSDEIGQLADALTAMTEQLHAQIDTMGADRNKTLAILAGMVEGVVAVDREERVVHANAAAQAISALMRRRRWAGASGK